jgi:formylglycine-generating enzyme required for sulfatase activity
MAFCRWLSEKLGMAVSLPTEAQWEKAARSDDGRRYPWGGELTPDHANYGETGIGETGIGETGIGETGIGETTAVGIFPRGASPYGVLDMSGNVWEWCLTKWSYDYTTPADDNAEGDDWRVVRGGSFRDNERLVRCASRSWYNPDVGDLSLGFRVVVSPRNS